jgi:hypothetical protein
MASLTALARPVGCGCASAWAVLVKPALYRQIVEASTSLVANFERVCRRTGLPFRVMGTETMSSPSPVDSDGNDAPVVPLLLLEVG